MISGKNLIKLLKKRWFELDRVKWSHYHFLYKGIPVTIPVHNKDIWRGLLRNILKQAWITHEDFLNDLWVDN